MYQMALRQLRARLVMVDDDYVKPQRFAQSYFLG